MHLKIQPLPITHMSVLIDIVRRTNGDVLEMGIGIGSTPVLHELCRGRKLVSYDSSKEYVDAFMSLASDWHELSFVEDWAKIAIEKPWSIAFIDHAPCGRRRYDIARLKDFADYVIVHDTEQDVDRFYRYKGAFSLYRYRRDYTFAKPFTTVLSNRHAL